MSTTSNNDSRNSNVFKIDDTNIVLVDDCTNKNSLILDKETLLQLANESGLGFENDCASEEDCEIRLANFALSVIRDFDSKAYCVLV